MDTNSMNDDDNEQQEESRQSSKRKREHVVGIGIVVKDYQPQDDDQEQQDSFWNALVSPNLEELSRRFPDFGRVYYRHRHGHDHHHHHGHRPEVGPCAFASFSSHNNNTTTTTPPQSQQQAQAFRIALTKALLQVHWGLYLTHVPEHHLCPPVPNRYFYVQWIQHDLLPLLRSQKHFVTPRPLAHVGLDIGTGPTCIYLLLFAASITRNTHNDNNAKPWTLYGTEVDPESLHWAQQNVQTNQTMLQSSSSIHLFLVSPTTTTTTTTTTTNTIGVPETNVSRDCHNHNHHDHDHIRRPRRWRGGPLQQAFMCLPPPPPPHRHDDHFVDFCMTNPPFYDDDDAIHPTERTERRRGDGRDRTNMTVQEGSYPGGEVGFVLEMIIDGLQQFYHHHPNPPCPQQKPQQEPYYYSYHEDGTTTSSSLSSSGWSSPSPPPPPGWTSCMCGKKASWIQLHHVVTELLGPAHVCSTQVTPGHLTRWFLAWTFEQPHMQSPLAQPDHWEFTITQELSMSQQEQFQEEVGNRIHEYCVSLSPGWNLVTTTTTTTCRVVRDDDHGETISTTTTCLEIQEAEPFPPFPLIGKNDKLLQLLPEPIQMALAEMDDSSRFQKLLPPQGHFRIDVTLTTTTTTGGTQHPEVVVTVVVKAKAYSHSSRGRKVVEKIKNQLQGEICRTNRKWRRKRRNHQKYKVVSDMDVDMDVEMK